MPDTSVATILVVEDEEAILDCVTDALEDQGYTVHVSTDAEGGLAILRDNPGIDLLFTDIRLPGEMNGWDLAEAARALNPELHLVYATGYTEGPYRILPGGQFFAKPYRIRHLLETISTMVRPRDHHTPTNMETKTKKSQDHPCAPSSSLPLSVLA